ncbi:hypothetical protein HYU19_05970, partial [Candidatus Woesearchaeota archaeon]|nr:hypothetical protein [Candidatus Woesearchaeota archaeon]
DHPSFVATQAHPELKSTLLKPAPLFMGLIEAAMERKRNGGVKQSTHAPRGKKQSVMEEEKIV